MTKPNRLGMFTDVRQILDAALAAGGGTYECPDHGAAVHWRQRAYRFRKAYAETLTLRAESKYDCIVMPRVPADSGTVTIMVRRQIGTFTPGTDGPSDVDIPDDLYDAAREIAERLDKGLV
jgi:hypothetical protein